MTLILQHTDILQFTDILQIFTDILQRTAKVTGLSAAKAKPKANCKCFVFGCHPYLKNTMCVDSNLITHSKVGWPNNIAGHPSPKNGVAMTTLIILFAYAYIICFTLFNILLFYSFSNLLSKMTTLGLKNVLVRHFCYKLVEASFWSETECPNLVFSEESPGVFLARKYTFFTDGR